MRLISARTAAGETLGVVVGDGWRAAAELLDGGPRTMADLLAAGPDTLIDLAAAAASATNISSSSPASPVAPPVSHVLAETDLLAPLPRPGKVVAIGRNYREHADEEGVDPPPAPLVFAKWPSSVVGPGADIRWDPALTEQVDYEAELAVVIGRTARNVSVDDALDHVFGYTCLNDVSARDIQFGDGQWVRGKSLDTFCPMGPCARHRRRDPRPAGPRDLVPGRTTRSSRTRTPRGCTSVSPRSSATSRGRSRSNPATSSRPARPAASASSAIRRGSSATATSSPSRSSGSGGS